MSGEAGRWQDGHDFLVRMVGCLAVWLSGCLAVWLSENRREGGDEGYASEVFELKADGVC